MSVWTVVALMSAIHAALLAHSAVVNSATVNEPAHLVAGLKCWGSNAFATYRVNPPLVKMIAALPVLAKGYVDVPNPNYDLPGARPEFEMAEAFVRANGDRSIDLIVFARWACIPLSIAGGIFCFLWSRELWGHNSAGLISLTLWCFDPNILAHGQLITPDCAAASLGLGAGYGFSRWLKHPGLSRTIVAGILLGLAELSKMTWVFLFVLWPMLWLGWRLVSSQNGSVQTCKPPLRQLATILAVGLYVLNLGYGFDGSLSPIGRYRFVSQSLRGHDDHRDPGNRFAGTVMQHVPVPLPKQFVLGMDIQKRDFEDYGKLSYLRGEWKDGGWWYYYLYGLAVKTTHGSQLLVALAILALGFRHRTSGAPDAGHHWIDSVVLLSPAACVILLVSFQPEFNHHLRYVLPALGFVFTFSGAAAHFCFSAAPYGRTGHTSFGNAVV